MYESIAVALNSTLADECGATPMFLPWEKTSAHWEDATR